MNSTKKLFVCSLFFVSGYSFGMYEPMTLWQDQGLVSWGNAMSNFTEQANDYTAKLFELCRGCMVLMDAHGNYVPYAQSRGVLAGHTRDLCFYGADLNSKDAFGKTPLHMVAENGFDEIAETLLKLGAVSKIKDNQYGETALHTALRYKKSYIASLLLENDKQLVDEKDNNGNTPLHVAVEHGVSSILVEDLLKNGAMFMILHSNKFEQNVINIAEKTNNGAIYKLLLDCILANPSLLEK